MSNKCFSAAREIRSVFLRTLYSTRGGALSGLCGIISAKELKTLMDMPEREFLLIDSRTSEEFEDSHIHGAVNIPEKRFREFSVSLPQDRNMRLIFYCNGIKCGKSLRSAEMALGLDYKNVSVFSEGMPVWEESGYPFYKGPNYTKWINTTKISPAEVWDLLTEDPGGLQVVDVCDKEEFEEEHIPGSINLPLASFASGSGILEKKKKTVVYCRSGGRSHAAYKKLLGLEFRDIYQLLLDDWKTAGLPVASAVGVSDICIDAADSAAGQINNTEEVRMSVVIEAPLKQVFNLVSTPHNWSRYVTGLKEVRFKINKPLAAGDMFGWAYSIRDIEIHGTGMIVELEKDRLLSLRMHTLVPIRKTVRFQGDEKRTVMSVSVGYDSPGRVVSFLFKSLTKLINKKESSIILERIKALCERGLKEEDCAPEQTSCPDADSPEQLPGQRSILGSALASAFL